MKRISISLTGGFFLAASAFGGALAQTTDRRAPQPYGPTSAGGPMVCVPWCQHDESPCDPPYFKVADRRCGRSYEMNR